MAVRKIPISEYYYRKREIDAFLNEKSDDDHTHGNIGNDGTVNSDTNAVNKIIVTDSSNIVKTINTLPLDKVTHQDISGKVNTSDIKDNLTSTDTNKPLSANQGNVLKGLVDSKAINTHNHGNINNNGTITTGTNDVNKIMVTDSSNIIKTIDTLPANKVIHQDISGKVNTSDIKNNLTSTDTDKPLSAKQGNELKTLVDSKANANDVYTKNQTMSAEDIRGAIAESIGDIDIFEIVSTLPTSNIKKNKFYLTPNGENIEKNVYDINIYINNKWETIDSLEFDISNYPTKSEITILLNGKVDKIDGKQLSTNDFTNALKNKLENQVLTQHQSLANYIQKSQTQGLVKNDGTIDTNEYLTIETIPKPFNYGFIDSDLVLHIMYIGTEISATKTIMQNGENNPITVIVSDEKGNLLEDMPVEFYINGVKVGQTINTNSNGVASYTYQGSGSGEIEVQVKIGSFVSEIYSVLDGLYFEDGTSDKSSNWNLSSVGYSSNGEYVTLNNASGGNRWCTLKIGSSTSYLDSTLDYCMEIDVKKDTATDIRLILDNTNVYVQNYVSASDFTHIKIYTSRSQSKVFYIIDGVTREVAMATANGNIQFRIANGESYSFKNFVVYPI
ncbi:Ig-like domain-containing protein [uncultured Methanobrevibacter sp.]|uniref:Ig-like domain-containing protein n=1 Tax=uncultured Methanobrevibacter sp. TaxID=253161 RepID=UPI0025FC54F3|nr:Ig-like domain-containing protein [uncultured Methanobrevibacter sp.]